MSYEEALYEREVIGIEKGEAIGMEKGEVIGIKKGEAIGMEKGEVIGMEKGEVIGIKKGEVIGKIKGAVETYLDCGKSAEETAMRIIKKFSLSADEAKEYVRLYYPSEF